MNALLAAERRGRALLLQSLDADASWEFTLQDDPDGHALLAAARAAPCLGITVQATLAQPENPSVVWQSLLPGCRSFAELADGDAFESAVVSNDVTIPDADAVWSVTLEDAYPRVRKDDKTTPALSCAGTRDIDRRAIHDYGVPGLCLMENAASAAVTVALDLLSEKRDARILIVAGGGNNGGDGFAMARGFARLGFPVTVALLKPAQSLSGDALENWTLLDETDIPRHELADQQDRFCALLANADFVVDALLGTGFTGALAPSFRDAIEQINAARLPTLAVDIPSGLDGDSGQAAEAAVVATRTITFAAVKQGLRQPAARRFVGDLYVADIGFAWQRKPVR